MGMLEKVFKCTVKTRDTSMSARVPFFKDIDDVLANDSLVHNPHKIMLARQAGYSHALLVSEEATVLYEKVREVDEIRVGAGPKAPIRYRNTAKVTIISPDNRTINIVLEGLEDVRKKYSRH